MRCNVAKAVHRRLPLPLVGVRLSRMSAGHVHLNGRIVPTEAAGISVSDAGFLHGASAFTTMLAHNGVVFRLREHLERLMATVRRLGLRCDESPELLMAGVDELLEANELPEARLRITLTPGAVSASGVRPTTLITADPLPEYPSWWYRSGIAVVIAEWPQTADEVTSGCKTGCYLPRVMAMQAAAGKGAAEALWFTQTGRLAEACFCNIFLVLSGQVLTPPLDTPVLEGMVRGAVVELCTRVGIECHTDRPLRLGDLLAAEEVFLTASCSGVRPVCRIERHDVGAGRVGEITGKIMSAYKDLLDQECTADR